MNPTGVVVLIAAGATIAEGTPRRSIAAILVVVF